MNASIRFNLLSFCAVSVLFAVRAQAQTYDFEQPPKVLVIDREYLKPGKSGTLHDKTESGFVKAMQAAKWPVHYIGMNAMTGVSRALFVVGYDSFAAWEKDVQDQDKNAVLSAALDKAEATDAELLTSADSGVFAFREELSEQGQVEIASMRYFDISVFKVKPGHEKEWEELAKIYVEGYKKAVPEMSWATFESIYGADNGGVFIVIQPLKNAAEIDKGFADSKKFDEVIGAAGQKRIAELSASSIESMQENLFHFDAKMSYVSERFMTIDPDFWKPKAAPAPKSAAAPPAKPQ